MPSIWTPCASGSSPRGRGKRGAEARPPGGHRLIPAWAGKTWTRCEICTSAWAHPRVGGENHPRGPPDQRRGGSSPRGRGKHHHVQRPPPRSVAHPRVGGENARLLSASVSGPGSSPRGRGKRPRARQRRRPPGLIPAWAGKTPPWMMRARASRAHPRVGGENSPETSDKDVVTGSSPRGRGKRL